MALFSDTSIPPWLQPKREPWEALLEGQQVENQIASNILRARSLQMQSAETTAQVGNIMASTELKKQQIDETNRDNAQWLKEAPAVSKWLLLPDDALATAPTPDVESQKSIQLIEKRRQAKDLNDYRKSMTDVRRTQAENVLSAAEVRAENNSQAVKDKKEWSDSFNRLSKEQRSKLMSENPGLLDRDGVPLPQYHGLINDALAGEKQQKVGTPKVAGGSREVAFTYLQEKRDEALKAGDRKTADELEGRINRLSRASGVDENKILSSIWEAKIKAIDKQLLDPANTVEKAKKDKGVLARRKQLIFERAEAEQQLLDTVSTQSETPKSGQSDNDPLNLFK